MRSPFSLVVTQRFEERRDLGAVDIVAAALALRFQHVTCAFRFRCGEGDCVFSSGRVVEGVDICKGVSDSGDLLRGHRREETRKMRRGRGSECLLDLLGAGKMR